MLPSYYQIFSPFLQAAGDYRRVRLPLAPSLHPPQSCAVLTFNPITYSFYVVCAVYNTRKGSYLFDVFSSLTEEWVHFPKAILHGIEIIRITGVSFATTACWIASTKDVTRRIVVRFDAVTESLLPFLPLPRSAASACSVQLGGIGARLGLVIVNRSPSY